MRVNWFEIRRKLLHVLIGTVLLGLIALKLITPLILFLVIIVGAVISIISRKYRIPVISWFLENFDRKKDRKLFPGRGAISLFVGILLAWKLFDAPIAYASIMVLILGDSVSHLVGTHFGRIKNPLNGSKSLEGNLIGGLAGFIGAMLFVGPWLAAVGSFGAMLIEAIQIRMNESLIDDNIIIPLAAGALMILTRILMQNWTVIL
jgi:dolichol kinase